MKNTEKKIIKSFAVHKVLWVRAMRKAKSEKVSLSSVLTYALREYLGL